MPTLRISSYFLASLFLVNAVEAHADPAPQVSPAPGAEPAPQPAGTPPVVTPDANANAPVAGNTAPSAADDSGRPPLGLAIGLGVVGVVCLGTGIGLGAYAKTRADQQEGNVNSPPLYTSNLNSRGHAGEQASYAAYALMGVGGAALIADVVVWIERLRKPKHAETAPTTSLNRVSATPAGLQVSF